MRAAIYNPYWQTLGGGERYTASVAKVLSTYGYNVDIQSDDNQLLESLEKRFDIKLLNTQVVPDINRGRDYDVCFWVSDGSVPLLYSRKNILHFQIPFITRKSADLINRMKFLRINRVVCNSEFTKGFIDKSYGAKSDVIYPPVDISSFKPKKKEKYILYVGRFSRLTQAKRQDILVSAFKKFYDSGYKDWKLILAGGTEIGVGDYLSELKDSSKGYPIKFVESPKFSELVKLVGSASFFWSAAGYGVDERIDPKSVEHFGITLVEAMAAKTLPLAFNSGGPKEVIKDGENGYLWDKTLDLVSKTQTLIKDKKTYRSLILQAQEDSQKYSYENFEKALLDII